MSRSGGRTNVLLCGGLSSEFIRKLADVPSTYDFVDTEVESTLALGVQIALCRPKIVMVPRYWLCEKGLGFLLDLHELEQEFAIVVVGSDLNTATIAKGIPLGLSGLIDLEDPAEKIVKALDRLCAGELWLSRQQLVDVIRLLSNVDLTDGVDIWKRIPSLTEREHTVLMRLLQGLSNQEIADALSISVGTAKVHVKHVFSKLGVHRRIELLTRH